MSDETKDKAPRGIALELPMRLQSEMKAVSAALGVTLLDLRNILTAEVERLIPAGRLAELAIERNREREKQLLLSMTAGDIAGIDVNATNEAAGAQVIDLMFELKKSLAVEPS